MSGRALLQLHEASSGESLALGFYGTGRHLVCGGEPGEIPAGQGVLGVWELDSGRGIQALRGLVSSARKVWFSPDSERVAALSDDWHLAVWDLALGRLVFLFETPVGMYADNAGGAFDSTGHLFAFAAGHEACLYDLAVGDLVRRWRLNDGLRDQIQFSRRGQWLLLRCERPSPQRASIWRLFELGAPETPLLLRKQVETDWVPESVALAPGGERFLVWPDRPMGTRRAVRAYDVASGRVLWEAPTERKGELRVWLDPTGRWLGYTAYGSSYRLRLLRWADGKEVGSTPEVCQAIGPTGRDFYGDGWLYLDGADKKAAIPLETDWHRLPDWSAFSLDGRLLA